ncbi:helix-turn-helix domain-containing protein [Halovenus sp. WSH3]|uniref:Helix-turn-helix domain-containing protein n=1 Tax=Halovenus carboxidivorans TaxID=2692199 RepID=A0A6B0SZ92_9EURY|nr:winged helix-turn-helix domain-containing protein [Halovenus carboxidivorans]MXR51158.1 helix-turn-helix domain-containing protein [Halovenus carboxidivorans]
MSSIFPLRETVSRDEQGGPRLLDLEDDAADEIFEALSASTTREIFLALHDQPQTASDLADATETSVQNVQYHLNKLEDVDLIEAVDTWYSERGSEMDVYAPTDEALVLFAGQDKERSIRSIFNRLVGVAGVLAPTSLLVAWAASKLYTEPEPTTVDDLKTEGGEEVGVRTVDPSQQPEPGGNEIGIASEEPTANETILDGNETDVVLDQNLTESPLLVTDGGNATQLSNETVSSSADLMGIDPALAAGLAFFCGGLFVLTALWIWYGSPE